MIKSASLKSNSVSLICALLMDIHLFACLLCQYMLSRARTQILFLLTTIIVFSQKPMSYIFPLNCIFTLNCGAIHDYSGSLCGLAISRTLTISEQKSNFRKGRTPQNLYKFRVLPWLSLLFRNPQSLLSRGSILENREFCLKSCIVICPFYYFHCVGHRSILHFYLYRIQIRTSYCIGS